MAIYLEVQRNRNVFFVMDSIMSSSSGNNQYICVGTKRISIEEDEYDGDACISLFRLRPAKKNSRSSPSAAASAAIEGRDWSSPSPRESFDGNNTVDHCLHLMATDGEHTFYKCIAAKDIKHMSFVDTDQLLDQVESILLQRNRTADDDQIFKVAYKMTGGQVFGGTQDTMNTTCVKVSIRKTLANQIVRPIWEGNLIPISHANYDTLPIFARHALPNNSASNQYENASSLAFSIILGDTITKLQKDITALREENDQLRINADRWKGTAQKLNNQWQSEKSELTERFLTLFNQHKGRHVELKKELDELKGNQRYERGESYLKPPPHSDHKERPEMRPDDEDEHDYVLYDDDYVNRMAAGGAVQQKRRRKNSTTEKTEVENVKALFSSDEEDNDMGV